MDFEQILYSQEDNIVVISLNRPERMDAWTYKMNDELTQAISAANDNADVGAIKREIVPELASSHFLVQRVGFGAASEMCLTGRLYTAAEALERGLPNQVMPHDQLMDTARELAREISANPNPQARMIKKFITENGFESDIQKVQIREAETLQEAYKLPQHQEAVPAFVEKRPPDFRNQA